MSLSITLKYMAMRRLLSSPYLACQPFWALIFLEKTEHWLRRVISVPSSIVKKYKCLHHLPEVQSPTEHREEQSEFLLKGSLLALADLKAAWSPKANYASGGCSEQREMAKENKWKQPFQVS